MLLSASLPVLCPAVRHSDFNALSLTSNMEHRTHHRSHKQHLCVHFLSLRQDIESVQPCPRSLPGQNNQMFLDALASLEEPFVIDALTDSETLTIL